MTSVLFALDAAKNLCTPALCPTPQNPTQPIQIPFNTAIPLSVSGIQGSYSTGFVPYRPPISLSGTHLSAINQISWGCTQPNGAACTGSPYVWTPNNWAGKVDIFNDTSIKVYPGLLALGDAAGTYNWTATFSALNSTPVSIPFSVSYQPQLATGIVVDGLSSAMFTPGTTTISTTTNPVVAALAVSGKNLGTVARIEWRWSGAATGSATWQNSDSTWSSKVAYTPDGKLALSPTVVETNPTWSGTVIWTGTLLDAAGASRNIAFSVVYQPPTTTPTPCTPPQVLTNGVCVTPPPTAAPSTPTGTATSGVIGTSSGPGPVTPSSTVNMSWNTSSGTGVDYNLIVTDVTSNTQALNIRLPGNTYTTALTAGHQYNWKVAACNTTGCSSYTAAQYFQTPGATAATPILSSISPNPITQGTSFQNVTFSGSGFTASSWTQYSVSGGSTWAWATSAPTFLSATSLSVAVNNTVAQTIYWRVCASNGSTSCSGSQTVTVQAAAVTIPATPTGAATAGVIGTSIGPGPVTPSSTVNMSWNTSSGAVNYNLIVTDVTSNTQTGNYTLAGNTYTVALTAGHQYSWQVAACNAAGCSPYTAVQYFQTPGAVAATLLVNGVASNYIGTGQKTISLSGSGFNSITQISWSCTMPNGTICTGSPYVWTPGTARWSNVTITSDTAATVYPTFLVATDPAGTYNWSVTFSGGGQSVTNYFTATK